MLTEPCSTTASHGPPCAGIVTAFGRNRQPASPECAIGDRLYPTPEEALADVREYVAVYYNLKRLHSTLGCTTPMVYEKNLNKVSGIA